MMKDIEIKINRETRMVDLSKSIIGNDGENLQGNLVFSFTDDFVKGQGRLEYVTNKEKKYVFLLKGEDNYYIPIKSVMTKEGQIDMQLVVTEGTDANEIPIFKSNVFYVTCKGSINAEIEEDEGYYQWIEIANTKLNEVDEAIEELASQSDYAKEQGDYAKEQGTNAKNVADDTQKKAEEGKFNGKSLEFVWQGTKLGVRLEGQEEYQFVDLQGVQGEIGATGEPFKIKKTYASVSEMNADFRNMVFGDYVMIASSVEVEDNAKLYTRGESAWIFISDFSGAMGIRGETGLTPNIKIGEVKTLEAGSQAKVTRSGSNEEPVFNFEIPKGDKGDNYVLTEEDKVEIGEKVNTEYEERIAENENDIVDIESYLDNLTPKASASGELVHITDALNLPTFENKIDGNVEQEGEPSPTNPQEIEVLEGDLSVRVIGEQLYNYKDIYISSPEVSIDKDGWITISCDNSDGTTGKTFNYWTHNLNVKEATKYNILCEIKNVTGTGGITLISRYYSTPPLGQFNEIDSIQFSSLKSNSVINYIKSTVNDFSICGDMGLRTYVGFGAGQSGSITFRLSVLEDTTITANNFVYKPYKEQIVPLDLKGNWVGKINDSIKDYLVTDKKKYWLVKNIAKYVFTGDESCSLDGNRANNSVFGCYTTLSKKAKANSVFQFPILSTHFKTSTQSIWPGAEQTIDCYGVSIILSISNNIATTKEELKAYLKQEYDNGTPVTVYYLTEETEIIELGELPEPIKTFEGTNNIQVLANLDTEIETTYALDLKRYYDNKIAELSSQII